MPSEASDSNYAAISRHRRPLLSSTTSSSYSLGGASGGSGYCGSSGIGSISFRPVVLEIVDDEWAADTVSDDEVEVSRHEAAVAPLLEEGELDSDAIVVSPTGNSSSAAVAAAGGGGGGGGGSGPSSDQRRRREESWNDLGLDQLDNNNNSSYGGGNGLLMMMTSLSTSTTANGNDGGNSTTT